MHNISPPTFASRASLSLITPLGVDSLNAQPGFDSSGGSFNIAFKVTDGRAEQLRNSSFSVSAQPSFLCILDSSSVEGAVSAGYLGIF